MSNMKEEIAICIRECSTMPAELIEEIKGGFLLRLLDRKFEGYSAFMPFSHGSIHGTKLIDVEKNLRVSVLEISHKNPRCLVVSGKRQLEAWIFSNEYSILSKLKIGVEIPGSVHGIGENESGRFGVFVDIGGMNGLLHGSKMPEGMVYRLRVGDPINVVVDSIDWGSHKIQLIVKENKPSPMSFVKKIIGRTKVYGEAAERFETMEAGKLKKSLEGMSPDEIKEVMPKLRKRADWPTRVILGGKYDWWTVVTAVPK